MARILSRLTGSGAGGEFTSGTVSPPADRLKNSNFVSPVKYNLELMMAGILGMNRFAGGSEMDMDGSAAGTFDLRPMVQMGVDNRSNQISGFSDANGAVLTVRFRFYLWTSTSSISLTPAVFNVTQTAAATVSGTSACTAGLDDYSGSGQIQNVTLTLHNSFSYYKPQVVLGGTPANGYRFRAYAQFDAYVALP